MKKSLPCLMLLGVLLLVGCASKKDANEKNFSEAINAYLAKRIQLCLSITSMWPVDLTNIGDSLNVVVQVERRPGRRFVSEVLELNSYDPDADLYDFGAVYQANRENT